jgi:hypothetical protein
VSGTVRDSPNAPRPQDPLVREIADMLARVERNYDREGSGPGSRFEGRLLEDVQAEAVARQFPAALAQALARLSAVRVYCEAKAAEFGSDVFPVRAEDMRVSAGDILGIIGGGK